jgi:diadenylate cyclase
MAGLHWQSVVDFLTLAAALYLVLVWSIRARAVRIALGVVALLAASLVARAHRLLITSWMLEAAALLVIAALLIVFQSEVRRALTRLDASVLLAFGRRPTGHVAAAAISKAAFSLAGQRVGALIVVTRDDPVGEVVEGGVPLGAAVSAALLEAVFQKSSPLHDGAIVIEGDRVDRAAALLPLTARTDVPPEFGTRHRAAMGLAERCDALVVTVSEQRGQVTLMTGRGVRLVLTADQLTELVRGAPVPRPHIIRSVAESVRANLRIAAAALATAAAIWLLAISTANTAIRTLAVPVMLQVPAGVDVTEQSTTTVVVRLRGPLWILDTSAADDIVAQVRLPRVTENRTVVVPITSQDLTLPPGVDVERAFPPTITLHLTPRGTAPSPAGGTPAADRR